MPGQDADRAPGRGHSNHHPTTALDADRDDQRQRREPQRESAVRTCPPAARRASRRPSGPTTMNASRAVSENSVRLAATNASASEQMAITTASPARASTDSGPASATASRTVRGHHRLQGGGGRRPDDQEPAGVEEVVLGGRRRALRAWRTVVVAQASAGAVEQVVAAHGAAQSSPTRVAAIRLARNRARTTSGRPGKATAVATSTTGLIAGADSRNASAAAAGAPRATSRPGDRHRPALAARQRHPGRRRGRHGQRRAAGAGAWAGDRPGRRRRRRR